VESTVLAAAAYADRERLLYLEFRSGAIYRYFDFPEQKYDEPLAADSKGQYFSRHMRDRSALRTSSTWIPDGELTYSSEEEIWRESCVE